MTIILCISIKKAGSSGLIEPILYERILMDSPVLYGWGCQAVWKTFLPHRGSACA